MWRSYPETRIILYGYSKLRYVITGKVCVPIVLHSPYLSDMEYLEILWSNLKMSIFSLKKTVSLGIPGKR